MTVVGDLMLRIWKGRTPNTWLNTHPTRSVGFYKCLNHKYEKGKALDNILGQEEIRAKNVGDKKSLSL